MEAPSGTGVRRKIGSIHESTTADTPEQNGKVERMNRSIVTKARSMLAGPGLPKRLWAEAMATACYLRNITPSVDKTKSPYEIWTGHRPSVEHLKVFGCVAYVHVDKKKRDKLELNAKKGIFVGYRKTTKQYRVLDPKTGAIIESSHVKFKENQKGGSILESTDESKICHHTDVITDQIFDQEEYIEDEEDQEKHIELCDLDDNVKPHEMDQLNNNVTYSSERRSQRIRRPPNRLIDELGRENPQNQVEAALMANADESEFIPGSYSEAMKYRKWRDAIETTLNSLAGNNTWNIVDKPKNVNLVSTKWIFKVKKLPNGEIDKFKARLVARGFTQQEGIDFFEVFSGVVRLETLRILIAIAAILDLEIEQMDFTSAFTQGIIEEDIFLKGIDGIELPVDKVLKLNRSLEGLKQSGRVWYNCISNSLKDFGLSPILADNF